MKDSISVEQSIKEEAQNAFSGLPAVSFKKFPLYGLTFLFLLHFILFVEPFGPDYVVTKAAAFCFDGFGFATVYCCYAFNKLHGEEDKITAVKREEDVLFTKRAWALKYLWEIKVNSVLLSLVLLFHILLFLKDGHQALGTYEPIDALDFILYTFPVWFLGLLMAFCVYFAVSANQLYSKSLESLENQAEDKKNSVSSEKAFGAFQVISKFSVLASFVFPNLFRAIVEERGFHHAPYFRMEFIWPVILFVIFMFDITPSTPLRLLLLTPSKLIFQSKEMQMELVENKKIWRVYVIGSVLILIGQLVGIRDDTGMRFVVERYGGGAFCGFIFFRIAQMAHGLSISSIAADVRAFKAGFAYLFMDTLFSMLNVLVVIGAIIAKAQFWTSSLDGSMDVYMVICGLSLFYICVRVMLFAARSVSFYNSFDNSSEEEQEELKKNQQRENSHVNDCFGVFLIASMGYFVIVEQFQLLEVLPKFAMALFWLLSLVVMSHKTSLFMLASEKASMLMHDNKYAELSV